MHHNGCRLVVTMTAALIFCASTVWAQSKTGKPQTNDNAKTITPLVTFVELGSVKCIPCRQMQPIMKSIEEKYGKQVKVIFYDVWKDDQREYAEKYGINVIPTQVFLDKVGKEFFRHEGFFPEAEIDKLLQKRGVNPQSGG